MKKNNLLTSHSRRQFIQSIGLAALSIPAMSFLSRPFGGEGEQGKKLGVALVGLGKYATGQLGPALFETQYCKLAGIVTGRPEKAKQWQTQYSIPEKNIYNYQNFDSIKDNPDIDIVYIVLPNALHAEYVIRAAKAGKHVICEKPMAVSVKECEDMILACEKADRLLSIGYRLHFDPFYNAIREMRENKTLGPFKKIIAKDGFPVQPNVWRIDKELSGGGPLMDVGIYCVQGALYATGEKPIAVTAKEGPKTDLSRFSEVEQSLTWTLEFPSGAIAQCETSYADRMNVLRGEAENGWFELQPAYSYRGITGKTNLGQMNLPNPYQQALQMDDFANCVFNNKKSKVPGEMGLRDMKILTAIYESARTGNRVELKNLE